MNAGWVKVDGLLWTDRKFLSLSTEGRLLFCWTWQPPHAAVCGLYSASHVALSRALGEPLVTTDLWTQERRVTAALLELDGAGMVRYDPENEVIWAVNRVKYAPTTPRSISLMRKEIAACPESPLVDGFIAKWGKTLGLARA